MATSISATTRQITSRVSTGTVNWQQLVERAWGSEYAAPDHNVYEFGNARGFDSTDRSRSGLYGVQVTPPFEFDEANMPRVPDMDTTLMVSDQDSTELLYIDPDPNPHVCTYSTSAIPGINTPGCAIPGDLSSLQPLARNISALPHIAIPGYAIPVS
jgi:hypothetical protein